ncbi:hypothetical protein ADUPG1_001411, partial [Aduncisulcus paluster]
MKPQCGACRARQKTSFHRRNFALAGAIEIFKIISSMLKQGHTAEDVMAELSRKYPVNVAIDAQGPELATPAATAQIQQANLEPA